MALTSLDQPFAGDAGPRIEERLFRTVALLARRGYALAPERLGRLCIGGPLTDTEVRAAVASHSGLALAEGIVVEKNSPRSAKDIVARAACHTTDSPLYLFETLRFVRTLARWAPFVRSVAIAGSLASGGFVESDDIDLNLIVDDGHRHIAYVMVNALGLFHALHFRGKPVDDLTRRPVAPRLMTANLILEVSQCHPLARTDEDMAFELLTGEPVFGIDTFRHVIASNPGLAAHFPQLRTKPAPLAIGAGSDAALPSWLFPTAFEGMARATGEAAWRYMQWTRRHSPAALERVAFVRRTMRPYTLFDSAG